LWVAGFDIIYGSQDYDFDKKNNLHSMATQFGVSGALLIAKAFHVMTLILLFILGILAPELGLIYYIGLLIIAALFVAEYRLISPTNLTNANIASYNINQIVSITLLLFGVTDALL
jgi:4-hydroxybenzoate polyprenyltransferase